MKAAGVDRNERVCWDREARRPRQSEGGKFVGRHAQGAALREAVGLLDRTASRSFPLQPPRRQPVRTCDISKRGLIVGDVGKEQPCLQRWVESVGMELQLRIGGTFGMTGENGLDIIEWFALRAC